MPPSVPLRHSLLVRLLTTSLLVALGSVLAASWLTIQTATRAIEQERGQALTDDLQIYNAMVDYATEHPQWDDVRWQVEKLAEQTGRRITLTTTNRQLITDSAGRPNAIAEVALRQASVVVDPLQVNRYLTSRFAGNQAEWNQIDPRILGPYRLTRVEKYVYQRIVYNLTTCMRPFGQAPVITYLTNGRPIVKSASSLDRGTPSTDASPIALCTKDLKPTAHETVALKRLNKLIKDCLEPQGITPVRVGPDFSPVAGYIQGPRVQACIDSARRQQLVSYVAPPALLFTDDANTPPGTAFELSPANTARIFWVTILVLTLTVLVTVSVGTRLIRPLRELAEVVRSPNGEQALGPVTRNDEIGHLTNAFRDLSERRLKAENQRKAMVNDIAHELRNPLNNIRGWLEAAEDGVTTTDRALTSSLLEEALLLQRVIDDLQDLAEADAGALRMHIETVPVADLLEQTAAAQRARAEAAGVLLVTHVDKELQADVDPVRLRQAVGNLVSNAIRYSPPGEIVTLRARRAGKRLRIDVGDHGSGISPNEIPYVFDRFWRAEKSRSRQTGGSGLGLAIVRQMVRAHGGEVSVVSTPGSMTVFTIDLPVDPVTGVGPEV